MPGILGTQNQKKKEAAEKRCCQQSFIQSVMENQKEAKKKQATEKVWGCQWSFDQQKPGGNQAAEEERWCWLSFVQSAYNNKQTQAAEENTKETTNRTRRYGSTKEVKQEERGKDATWYCFCHCYFSWMHVPHS